MKSYIIFILFFLNLFKFDCYFFTKRFDNFEKADQVIEAQNSNPNRKCSFAHNEFSHMVYNLMELFLFELLIYFKTFKSQEEFNAQKKGIKIDSLSKKSIGGKQPYSSINGVVLSVPVNMYNPTTGYVAPASVG